MYKLECWQNDIKVEDKMVQSGLLSTFKTARKLIIVKTYTAVNIYDQDNAWLKAYKST